MAETPKSGGKKDGGADKAAARKSARAAAKAIPPSEAATPGSGLNDHMLQFKRKVAATPELQDRLAAAKTEDEFHKTAVSIGAQHGFTFTAAQSKAFVAKTRELRAADDDEPAPQPETTYGCAPGYTHDSSNACTWNIYKC